MLNKNVSKKKTIALIISISVLLISFILYINLNGEEIIEEEETLVSVDVMEAQKKNIYKRANLIGAISPTDTRVVVPELAGKVDKVMVEEGDYVEAGDILFTLENRDYQLQVNEAQAQLRGANAQLNNALQGSRDAQIMDAKTSVNRAEQAKEQMERELERVETLYEEGFASKQQLEQVELQYMNTKEMHKAALAYESTVNEGATAHQIEALNSQVERARVGVEFAERMYNRTIVRAPMSGEVVLIEAKEGQLISNESLAVLILNDNTMKAMAAVPENYVNNVSVGDEVDIKVPSAKDESFKGQVSYIGKIPPEGSRAYPMEINIDNEDGVFRAGMYSTIDLVVDSALNTFYVPRRSLVIDRDEYYVYLVKEKDGENIVELSKIELGISEGGYIEVKDGIEKGDIIVVNGVNQIEEGDLVNINMVGDSE